MKLLVNKHKDVQNNYKKLGYGKNNLARFEHDKDYTIDKFTDKQIEDHERRMQEENERRRQRRLQLLREMQQANSTQIQLGLFKKMKQKQTEEINEKLMIMKDLASKQIEDDDEKERSVLKKHYLKQTLDMQNTQNLLNKRQDFILNDKELGMNHSIINKMNKSRLQSKDEIQEDLIQKSYMKSFI